jgi:multiple sugar transport system substrate-binding protein
MRLGMIGAGLAALLAALAAGSTARAAPFSGVTVNLATTAGPERISSLQDRAVAFAKATGAAVNIVPVPVADLYDRLMTDWSSGSNAIDAAVFSPRWLSDFAEAGFLAELGDRMAADKALAPADIAGFFRKPWQEFAGKTYLLTLDGEFALLYYRTDLFEAAGLKAPETWDDYLAAAKSFAGKDLNGDGSPDYGSCVARASGPQASLFPAVAGAFIQAKGPGEGFFFDPGDMKPLVDNEAFARALDVYAESTQSGPPDERDLSFSGTRALFTSGRCALTIDSGRLALIAAAPGGSQVSETFATALLPGSRQVLDRDSGKLQDCTAERCPYAIESVNHAPFASADGWVGGINGAADTRVKDAAYAFLSTLAQPAQSNLDVTNADTGINPFRTSQARDAAVWIKAGLGPKAAAGYLAGLAPTLASRNVVSDLRIPQSAKYGAVLDDALASFLAGTTDKAAAMKAIADGWNGLNDQAGKDKQLQAYKATIGAG